MGMGLSAKTCQFVNMLEGDGFLLRKNTCQSDPGIWSATGMSMTKLPTPAAISTLMGKVKNFVVAPVPHVACGLESAELRVSVGAVGVGVGVDEVVVNITGLPG